MPKGNRGGKNGETTGFYETVDSFEDAKIIKSTERGGNSLPRMSNSPNAIYILKNASDKYKSIGVYDKNREIAKEFDIGHGHKARDKNGKIIQWLKRGYVHTHTSKGGRENNTRYPTKKEIKMYGKYIKYIGGKLHE